MRKFAIYIRVNIASQIGKQEQAEKFENWTVKQTIGV